MVGLGLGPIRGAPFSPSVESRDDAGSASIPPVTQLMYLKGYSSEGDGGQHAVRRVYSEPSHAGKVRTADRYLPNGNTDATNGGWWEIAEIMPIPEMFGAVGDGITDDTAAVTNWLNFGGGRAPDGSKVYMIDPIALTTPATVVCARVIGNVPAGETQLDRWSEGGVVGRAMRNIFFFQESKVECNNVFLQP